MIFKVVQRHYGQGAVKLLFGYQCAVLSLTCGIFISGCATLPEETDLETSAVISEPTPSREIQIAENDEFVVLITQLNDSVDSLAERYLGDKKHAWKIAAFNNVTKIQPKMEIVIPRFELNPTGVRSDGYPVVPILCYHRFGKGHIKMSVETDIFRRQMTYLKEHGYNVVAMSDVVEFINGKQSLPPKAVVITIDDGYASVYSEAYPIFKELNIPATVFLYTDFMGSPDALSWEQIKEMHQSGLVDFQPHSKSHPNLTMLQNGEPQEDYLKRLEQEVEISRSRIEKMVSSPMHTFAYPFGDTNEVVINTVAQNGFTLGVTVQPGVNPAFASHYLLRRTMIFGDHTEKEFVAALKTFEPMQLR